MFFWKLLFANYHFLVSCVNLCFFCVFYPPSIPITGVPVYPWKHSQLDLVGRGNHTQKALKASSKKIHPLLYGYLLEFLSNALPAEFSSRESTVISTGQFLEHLSGSRFYPDKNVSCLDQNVASSTNLRICNESVYMQNLLNVRNLLQILVESTGVNLMWRFFSKTCAAHPQKNTPTNLRSWPESIHWESRLTNVAPEMVRNSFVSSPKKNVAGIDQKKTHTKPDA